MRMRIIQSSLIACNRADVLHVLQIKMLLLEELDSSAVVAGSRWRQRWLHAAWAQFQMRTCRWLEPLVPALLPSMYEVQMHGSTAWPSSLACRFAVFATVYCRCNCGVKIRLDLLKLSMSYC